MLWDQRTANKRLFLRKVHNLGSCAAQGLIAAQRHWLQAIVLDGKQPAIKFEVPIKKVLQKQDSCCRHAKES